MGLKQQFEKYHIITDEDIARGVVYAWTLVVVADERVAQEELQSLERFAAMHHITRRFNNESWLEDTVGEALNVYNTEGPDSLLAIIKDQLGQTSIEARRVLLYSLVKLACVDEDFSQQELEILDRIIEMLDISRKDVLMIGILYATDRETTL